MSTQVDYNSKAARKRAAELKQRQTGDTAGDMIAFVTAWSLLLTVLVTKLLF